MSIEYEKASEFGRPFMAENERFVRYVQLHSHFRILSSMHLVRQGGSEVKFEDRDHIYLSKHLSE
jgi:hypothetical protein